MIFVYILLAFIALLIIIATVAPKKYHLERTIIINKPISEIFTYLKSVKNQDNWSPLKKKDPEMKQEFFGEDGTVGFISRWEGNKEVGIGEQEIKAIVENKQIDTELRFIKPWKSVSDAFLKVKELNSNSTEVIWGFSGVNKVPMNIMMLFFNMDTSVGTDFNEGLESLKQVLESK
jgi:hypothetical protein